MTIYSLPKRHFQLFFWPPVARRAIGGTYATTPLRRRIAVLTYWPSSLEYWKGWIGLIEIGTLRYSLGAALLLLLERSKWWLVMPWRRLTASPARRWIL